MQADDSASLVLWCGKWPTVVLWKPASGTRMLLHVSSLFGILFPQSSFCQRSLQDQKVNKAVRMLDNAFATVGSLSLTYISPPPCHLPSLCLSVYFYFCASATVSLDTSLVANSASDPLGRGTTAIYWEGALSIDAFRKESPWRSSHRVGSQTWL